MINRVAFLTLFLLLSTACSYPGNTDTTTQNSVSQIGYHQANDQTIADEAKRDLIKWEAIIGVNAVQFDKKMIVGINIRQRNKLQSQALSKKAKKDLQKKFKNLDITVSADQKTFIELKKTETQLAEGKLDNNKLQKRFKKIKKIEDDRY